MPANTQKKKIVPRPNPNFKIEDALKRINKKYGWALAKLAK